MPCDAIGLASVWNLQWASPPIREGFTVANRQRGTLAVRVMEDVIAEGFTRRAAPDGAKAKEALLK